MTHLIARFLTIVAAFALITTAFAGATAFAAEDQDGNGAVYTQTNAASGNAVLAFRRADDGTLTAAGSYPTGGVGSGARPRAQGAPALCGDGRWVFLLAARARDLAPFAVPHTG